MSKFKRITELGLFVRLSDDTVDAHDLEALLEKAVRVDLQCGDFEGQVVPLAISDQHSEQYTTHTALLIDIRPIERDSLEKLAKDLITDHEALCKMDNREPTWEIYKRARKLVGK